MRQARDSEPSRCRRTPRARRYIGGDGHGVTIAIARGVTTCPVKAVKAWLQASGISEGPLFRPVAKGGRLGAERLTDQSVCSIVKALPSGSGSSPPTSAPIPYVPAS